MEDVRKLLWSSSTVVVKEPGIQSVANQIAGVLRGIRGAVDVFPDQIVGRSYLQIEIDRENCLGAVACVNLGEQVIDVELGSGMIWPVAASTRFSFIHFQFSSSNSGHSVRNFSPPSPALTFPIPFTVAETPGTDFARDPPPVEFHHLDRAANSLRSASEALTLPVVISSLVINDISPMRIVDTSHAGLNDFGWKSLILRQSRVEG